MRSRSSARDEVAEAARRRLDLLVEDLGRLRQDGPTGRSGSQRGERPGGRPESPLRAWDEVTAQDDARSATPGSRRPPGRHAARSVGSSALVEGWVQDRLPPTLQGRVRLRSAHLAVLALLVASALGVVSWWAMRADGVGTIVSRSAPDRPAGSPASLVQVADRSPSDVTTPQPSASARGVVVVDVAGKVRRPGIATLPTGSRVVDALRAAGGARRGVDLSTLNLARVLVDGEQILVGVRGPVGVAADAASAPGTTGPLVNINTAQQAELETLPGVGPVTAGAILKWRTDNGAFTSVDELLEISGIGDATLAEMAPFVTL